MFKKFFTYPVFVVLFLSFIGTMLFGAIIRYHYEDYGEKYKFLRETALLIAEIPINIRKMKNSKSFHPGKQEIPPKHKNKKRFERFIENKRDALMILPRYDHSLSRSVINIIDLNNFEIIHTYKHDIDEMYDQVTNLEEYPSVFIDNTLLRFEYDHSLILDDGSLIGLNFPLYKIDFCSNLQWINDEEVYHHSQMLDHEGNIWVGSHMNPKSKYVKEFAVKNYEDNSIVKINIDGNKILFNKSITEILIENEIIDKNFFVTRFHDPLHLNDIEPALTDTQYWKQGDLFISLNRQSAIMHYRPSTNKVINYIKGPFAMQHDVDVISDKEISLFNNNNFMIDNEHSEILIYNFETKKFKQVFQNQLITENFKTKSLGQHYFFNDGSLMVEESNHGRIILFNNNGEKEWEFVNKDKNGDIGLIKRAQIIEDKSFIDKFKLLTKNKKCLN